MSIIIALGGSTYAQLLAGPEEIRVRFGTVAGGGFLESSSQVLRLGDNPDVDACYDGSGWVLGALQNLLQQIAPKPTSPRERGALKPSEQSSASFPAMETLRRKLLGRLRAELRTRSELASMGLSSERRDWREICAIIVALGALDTQAAVPELQSLAKDRHVAPGVRLVAERACLRLGVTPGPSLLPAYLRALSPKEDAQQVGHLVWTDAVPGAESERAT